MISIKSLRIDYEDVQAVADLNLEIPKGQIFGFVGPNGAGKTSTIKALAGVLDPTYGQIMINGHDLELEPEKTRQLIGYMPDFPPVYENLKVWEYCDVFAAAYLIPRKERLNRVKHWIEQVNLLNKWDSYVRDLSRGMRQRLVLAKTLISNPDVLLLDEPAAGLDPIVRREFSELLKKVAGEGRTIIISSHILTELSDFCNAIGIMEKGKMVVAGTLKEIREHMGSVSQLLIRGVNLDATSREKLLAVLSQASLLHDIKEHADFKFTATMTGDRKYASDILAQIVSQQIAISDFSVKEADVEDIFFQIGAKDVT
ncbi:MAG: ABC transporter ATP-binding protein [Candidatus Omnitrophica bacterium]|nr:ABC transporter ATP-binding protein [Candidatus Omnitrophota bacterium]